MQVVVSIIIKATASKHNKTADSFPGVRSFCECDSVFYPRGILKEKTLEALTNGNPLKLVDQDDANLDF